jgi:dipeptidyl aminopeptidase/acylaminoacyl peptidase
MSLRKLLCLASLVLLASLAAAGAGFTLEQVMSSPFPHDLVAAEKANRIAWVFNQKGVRNVWVADGPDFKNARAITRYTADDGQEIASLRLTPDGRTAVYVRGSELNDAGEVANPTSLTTPPKQQVWAVEVENKSEPRLLGEMGCAFEGCEDIEISPDGTRAAWATKKQIWMAELAAPSAAAESDKENKDKRKEAGPAKQLFTTRGDNSSPRWSPDGKMLAFVSDRTDHSLIGIYAMGASNLHWMAPSVDIDILPHWSPDGTKLAFIRRPGNERGVPMIPERPAPWAIEVTDVATGQAREVWHSGKALRDSYPELTEDVSFYYADAGRITFASEQDGRNHLYSIADSGGQPTLLTPGEFDVEHVTLSADKKSLIFSSNQDDVERRHIWRVAVTGGKPQALSRGETAEWSPVEVSGQVVCLGSSATTAAMPYRLTASGRDMLAANELPKDFPSQELVTPKIVTFQSEDSLTIHGQLFVPRGRTQPGPALIFTHGGPIRQMMPAFHYMGYYHNAYAENQYLASQGYVVLSVNYRLGVMYGRDFREVADGGWRGSSEYKDVLAGTRYLQSLPIVDKTKIGLWGGSYGGLLTALGLSRNSDIFAAGVDFHGVHDWSVLLPANSTAPDLQQAKKLAFESSPNAAVKTWRSPVLLIQGDDDRNVPESQTVDLAQRLRGQNVPFEQIIFPDEIHDLLLWRDWVRAYHATADFFDRNLKAKGKQ